MPGEGYKGAMRYIARILHKQPGRSARSAYSFHKTRLCGLWLLVALLSSACAEPEMTAESRLALTFSNVNVTNADQTELPFTLISLPASNLEAYLTFRARIDSCTAYKDGSAPVLLVWLNPQGNQFDTLGGLDATRLVNKPLEMKTRRGERYPYCSGGTWRLLRSNDMVGGTGVPQTAYDDVVNGNPYEFRLRVTNLLKVGNNLLAFQANPKASTNGVTVKVEDISIDYLDPTQNVPVETTPPWGDPAGWPMKTYKPTSQGAVPYTVSIRKGGGIDVGVSGRTYAIESEFSFPLTMTTNGGTFNRFISADALSGANEPGFTITVTGSGNYWEAWAQGANYTIHREVDGKTDHIEVTDTITHLADEGMLGIHMQHNTPLVGTGQNGAVYLAGNRLHWTPAFFAATEAYPENPTVYYSADGAESIGLLARDDVFRAHARLFVDSFDNGSEKPHFGVTSRVGISDAHLGISDVNGGVHVSRWDIYPTTTNDYWEFINRARRNLNVNFEIPGGFSFIDVKQSTYAMSSNGKQEFVTDRGLKMVSTALGEHWPNQTWVHAPHPPASPNPPTATYARYAHGLDFPTLLNDNPALDMATGFQGNWIEAATAVLDGFAAPSPGVKKLVYFHAFISAPPGGLPIPSLYDSSRILNASLQPVEYEDDYRLLDPSVSAYSQAMETNIDIILDTIDADGVYWDEMDHSHVRVTYSGEDGHTVDTVRISPGSGVGLSGVDITRAYSNVTLKTLAWRVQKALALLAAGKTLVANGAPETETMASVHFPRFVETSGGASILRKTHLFTPIALGDLIWDFNDAAVARQIWERIEEGGLYYHYHFSSSLSYPKVTSYMFPFTPIEIRPGVLIGSERILLSRSAITGWSDGVLPSAVHVFDEEGVEVANTAPYVTYVNQDVSVELPYGYTAALIR